MEEKNIKELDEKEKEALKKKIATGLIASVTSASVLLGGTFDSPKDIINDEYHKRPVAVVETMDDDGDEDTLENHEKDKAIQKEKIKKLIYRIPVKIRSIICIPLWAVGTILIAIFTALFNLTGSAILAILFNFFLTFLFLFLTVIISLKLLFPGIPLRKLLNKKIFLFIFLASIIISLADIFMPMIWNDYNFYRNISKFIIGLFFLVLIIRPFITRKFKEMNELEVIYE